MAVMMVAESFVTGNRSTRWFHGFEAGKTWHAGAVGSRSPSAAGTARAKAAVAVTTTLRMSRSVAHHGLRIPRCAGRFYTRDVTERVETPPTGTVTLLFGDVEGSTRLLHALGERYSDLLARLRQLVREAIGDRGGYVVDWAGDGVFAAFPRALDAVQAAVEIQKLLAGEPWPEPGKFRLRIGIHTGAPEVGSEGYVGPDVHRASRICSAAHGGQVIVSGPTRDLVGDNPLLGLRLQPLGSHRLRDLPGHESLFQVVGPGLQKDFPPLRTLGGVTLPALHYRLVGRRNELMEVHRLLAQDDVRLVTVTGPGGAGKSRLTLEVASELGATRPVCLVGLAPIADPDLVPAAVARALGVVHQTDDPLVEQVADALAGTGTLLVLDNFEHVAPAAATIAALLDRASGFDVLVTSRAPLRLARERTVVLEPLPIDDAATLFAEIAAGNGLRLPSGSDSTVREICRRLDGLPLAIELVVARLSVLPPAALLRELDEGLALRTEGSLDLPERQRTLEATIDWSYGLLSEVQRNLHSTFAVFVGGCSLEDAQAVVGTSGSFLDDLHSLVAVSLLRSDAADDGEPRLTMLETVRQYALARLAAAGSLEDVRTRHAARFVALADEAEDGLTGRDQASWQERLQREHDNIRAALEWLLANGRGEDALRALAALNRFWRAQGHVAEARGLFDRALAAAPDADPGVRARALWAAGRQAAAQNDYSAVVPLLEEALRLFRGLGEIREAVFALCELAWAAEEQGDLETAEALTNEALVEARAFGDPRALSAALSALGDMACERRDYENARALYSESLGLRRQLDDPLLIVSTANSLGWSAKLEGDLEAAEAALGECLTLAREIGDKPNTASALCMLGEVALSRDEVALAGERLSEAYALYDELRNRRLRAECLHGLGGVAAAEGRAADAARLWGAADALRAESESELTSAEHQVEERYEAAVREELGPAEYERVRRAGRGMDVADLVTRSAPAVGNDGDIT
jgi:predicted ATPase/class 3 adenylate cyclase